MGLVAVDVGTWTYCCPDCSREICSSEAGLYQSIVRVAFIIDSEQIVSRLGDAYLVVRDCDGIMHIVHNCGLGIFVIVDSPFIEAVEKLRIHEPFRHPFRIAVGEWVAQVTMLIGKLVKRHYDSLAVIV